MHKIGKGKPVAYLCKSGSNIEELLKCAQQAHGSFVQLFRNRKEVKERLLSAYFNALLREKEGIMRSNSLGIETLLFVSGQMNISKAVAEFGVSGPGEFILFASSKEGAKDFLKCSKAEIVEPIPLKFTEESARVAVSELLEA
ncbi:MAG: KEOPS complex subunit Cgi121 [Candidatus Micrarchaeia archaeon]